MPPLLFISSTARSIPRLLIAPYPSFQGPAAPTTNGSEPLLHADSRARQNVSEIDFNEFPLASVGALQSFDEGTPAESHSGSSWGVNRAKT